jgi:uncharacterized protein (TIGR02246 family)
MKIRLLLALVGLAISFAVPAFAQQKDTVDPKIAEQIRALATKFDEALNKNDAVAVAAFLTDNALWTTPHGTLSGREVIETDYAEHEFRRYRCNNLSTKIERVDAVGKDVRATGTWSCTFQDDFGHTKHVKGQTAWVLVQEGDTWKIRENTYDQSDPY